MDNLMKTVLYYTAVEDDVNFSIFLDKLKSKFYGCGTNKRKIQELIDYISAYDLGNYQLAQRDLRIICNTLAIPTNTLIIG